MKRLALFCGLSVSVLGTSAQVSFTNMTQLIGTQGLTTSHPVGIMDMNGDNKDDLLILDGGNTMYVNMQGAADLPFTEFSDLTAYGSSAWGMCGGDIDSDGYSDVIFGGWYDDVQVMASSGTAGSYNTNPLGAAIFVQGINTADIDNDGNLDIFICHDDGPSQIFLGDGNQNFTLDTTVLQTALYGGGENDSGNYGSVWTDIDNDGDIDLYISKCRQGVSSDQDLRRINQLHINNGDGTYTESAAAWNIASGEQTWMADFGDIDNDGDMDLMLGQHSGERVQLFENDGNGSFTDITTAAGLDTSFPTNVIQAKLEDFDNDGFIDLLVAGVNGYVFYMNNGNSTFDYSAQPAIGCEVNSFCTGDLNSDGFIDFYATSHGFGAWSPVGDDSLYFNDGNSNNFLTVSLEGTISNPDAIGARIAIYGPWGVQLREVRSGESYGIQNTLNGHFGLGAETSVDSVVISWPSGNVDTHYNVNGGFVTYFEGSLVGITDPVHEFDAKVYPNPATDAAFITLEGISTSDVQSVNLLNAAGQQVQVTSTLNGNLIQIERNNLPAGLYFIELQSRQGKVYADKIIFQ